MCVDCGLISLPAGRNADTAEFFRFPAPYVLAGPEPSQHAADVYRIVEACKAAKHPYWMRPGLAMLAGSTGTYSAPRRQWFVTFHIIEGHQRFHEASASDMLISDLEDLLEYLRTHPEPA